MMAERDKFRELAEKLVKSMVLAPRRSELDRTERILRAELKTLLDAAQDHYDELPPQNICLACEHRHCIAKRQAHEKLAAELKGWEEGLSEMQMTRKDYREYLNALFPANSPYPHTHHRFRQRTRAYGDYLYHQDREKFEADYQAELRQRSLQEAKP